MKRRRFVIGALFVCFLGAFFSASQGAQAADTDLTPKWQLSFPDSVRWYVRTSLGILLVRSGHSLTAIDGVDGKQLWSLPEIEIGEGLESKGVFNARGANLLEIPGYSVLLINGARLANSKAVTGELLAVDLKTGQVLWRQPEFNELFTLIPFYDSGRVLVVTRKFEPARYALENLPYASIVTSVAVGDAGIPFKVEMHLLDPLTGKVDWSTEYPHIFGPRFFDVQALDGRVFLHEVKGNGKLFVGAFDLKTGVRVWEFGGGMDLGRGALPELQFAAGHIIIGNKGVAALDPSSGTEAWTVSGVGSVFGLLTDGDTVFGTGSKKIFALDVKTGTQRWESSGHNSVTAPVFYKKSNLLAFCEYSKLLVLDASTGKLVRQGPLFFSEPPLMVYKIGDKFLVAFSASEAGVYNVETAEKIGFEGEAKGVFPAVAFLMRQYMPGVGSLPPPLDLQEELEKAWPAIIENAKKGENGPIVIDRVAPFLQADFSDLSAYAAEFSGAWRLWHVNPETGITEAVEFKGSKPDVDLTLGLFYFVDGKTLKAVPWRFSLPRDKLVPPPPPQ